MSALIAYKKIEKSAITMAKLWWLNNLLSTILIFFLIYKIWWEWHLGLLGIIVFIGSFKLFNSIILTTAFDSINERLIEKATDGAQELTSLKIIDWNLLNRLINYTKLINWPAVIINSMPVSDFKEKILGQTKN